MLQPAPVQEVVDPNTPKINLPLQIFTGVSSKRFPRKDMSSVLDMNGLVWWRGQPFKHQFSNTQRSNGADESGEFNEDIDYDDIMSKTQEMRAGRWRRMFEKSLNDNKIIDEADDINKMNKRIAKEIGVLDGMHKAFSYDMLGVGKGYIHNINTMGIFMDR
jgi:hypothetical protein